MLKNKVISKIIYTVSVTGLFFVWSCTKLDTTNLGDDLIPAVDNINTFADTFDIVTTPGEFLIDTTKVRIDDYHALGVYTDPLLGTTVKADVLLQLKPTFFPFYFGTNQKDSIIGDGDSAVLCLAYTNQNWGDTSHDMNMKLQAYQLKSSQGVWWDSSSYYRPINFPQSYLNDSVVSNETLININTLSNTVKVGVVDTVTNQIRIKLTNDFKNKLFKTFNRDSSGVYNAYRSDSLFKSNLNGFVIKATSGNALVYIDLLDPRTRLELHYRKRAWIADSNRLATTEDTVYTNFTFNTSYYSGMSLSSHGNKITVSNRNLPSGGDILLQSNPGTYANLYIPRLEHFVQNDSNRIIHRAEIQVTQTLDDIRANNKIAPEYLYLDLIDSSIAGIPSRWKPIYHDLNPLSNYNPDNISYYYPYNEGVNFYYFGVGKKTKSTGQVYYNVNVSRYLQNLVTNKSKNYPMRLFVPHNLSYPQFDQYIYPYKNLIGKGAVKVGGGSSDPSCRMRMVVIYSKLK